MKNALVVLLTFLFAVGYVSAVLAAEGDMKGSVMQDDMMMDEGMMEDEMMNEEMMNEEMMNEEMMEDEMMNDEEMQGMHGDHDHKGSGY